MIAQSDSMLILKKGPQVIHLAELTLRLRMEDLGQPRQKLHQILTA